MPEIVLECQGVIHHFGQSRILHDINLRVVKGEIVSLVGPSGCGKSTLLRAILGTHPPREGEILVNGIPTRGPGRDRGIVYQRYSLFPFLTAQQNVALGLLFDQSSLVDRFIKYFVWRKARKKQLEEAAVVLQKLGLEHALHLYPHEMSGGMCQRVAIAQAIIMKPQILLLDEPFGALDEATREELQKMLLTFYAENVAAVSNGGQPPYTIILVTHELNEAIYVADRVVALSQYWDWRGKGFESFPGATIVYDQMAPAFAPTDEIDHAQFLEQRTEIRTAAFDPNYRQERDQFNKFWGQVQGKGEGVLKR
ncbi:MAG: ATP-binding cassette domain-containing protein [Candidatus Poribacteria bacterium]|nr:ATP-binding cassette domain-containing protein [Candidatus Poribacteria bacterium]